MVCKIDVSVRKGLELLSSDPGWNLKSPKFKAAWHLVLVKAQIPPNFPGAWVTCFPLCLGVRGSGCHGTTMLLGAFGSALCFTCMVTDSWAVLLAPSEICKSCVPFSPWSSQMLFSSGRWIAHNNFSHPSLLQWSLVTICKLAAEGFWVRLLLKTVGFILWSNSWRPMGLGN